MIVRVGIYARFSSEVQNARSVDDQVEVCRRHALARGWAVVAVFSDHAISGAHMVNRPGLLSALAAAERGDFDVLLCEHEDRIARNLEHLAHVANRLDFAGRTLATLSTDRVETMHVAFNGAMAQVYLKDLAAKTRRGMTSNAEKGLATGSRTYGYKGQPGGQVAIVDDEAAVVREIFARFGAGEPPRAIVADLNARRIPGPRGGAWAPSTLNGSRQRGNGILNTELYAGVKVWNRIEMRKDPRTGLRISRPRPAEDWKRTPVPHLRIVDEAAWAAVQARKATLLGQTPYGQRRRKQGLFSGLIRCGLCGASMTAFNSRGRVICVARREKGPAVCANGATYARAEIETRVLEGLKARLLSPAAVALYVRTYHAAWAAKAGAIASAAAPKRKRLAELERQIDRLVDAICDGSATATPAFRARLEAAETEKAQIAAELQAADQATAPPVMTLLPRTAKLYADRVAQLQAGLAKAQTLDTPASLEQIEAARALVQRIDVSPPAHEGGRPNVTLHGTLARFMNEEGAPEGAPRGKPERLYKVVAGARYSLTQTGPALRIAC